MQKEIRQISIYQREKLIEFLVGLGSTKKVDFRSETPKQIFEINLQS